MCLATTEQRSKDSCRRSAGLHGRGFFHVARESEPYECDFFRRGWHSHQNRRLAAARRRHNELDEKSLDLPDSNRWASSIFDDAMNHEYDREWALRQSLSFERAESCAGAAIQVAECLIALDSIWGQFPSENETFAVKQDYRRLNRLLFSVLRFLKQEAASELDGCIDDTFRDPWLPAEDAIERHETWLKMHEATRQARIVQRSAAR